LTVIACLFSPLGKLAERAIYFANVISLFFLMLDFIDPVAQNLMDRFYQNVRIGRRVKVIVHLIELFFRFFKRRCHGNQLKLKNRHFPGPIYFVALLFGSGLQYLNSDFKRFNRVNFSTLSTVLVAFGP